MLKIEDFSVFLTFELEKEHGRMSLGYLIYIYIYVYICIYLYLYLYINFSVLMSNNFLSISQQVILSVNQSIWILLRIRNW